MTEAWLEFLVDGLCGLCANTGIIDKKSVSPAGVKIHLKDAYCICPNGRALKHKPTSFEVKEWLHIAGRGHVAIVVNDRYCKSFEHLLNKRVILDDKDYYCTGVESYATAMHRAGESIGILIKGEP